MGECVHTCECWSLCRGVACVPVCACPGPITPQGTKRDLISCILSASCLPFHTTLSSAQCPACMCAALPTSPAPARAPLQPAPHYRLGPCNSVQAFTPAVLSISLVDSYAVVLTGCHLLLTLLLSQPAVPSLLPAHLVSAGQQGPTLLTPPGSSTPALGWAHRGPLHGPVLCDC